VIYLLYARAEGRDFHLPGSDGAVVMAAGLWTALLLVFRLFDKPGISSHGVAANVGVQWGIFFALGAAGLLAYAGSRMRSSRPLEPPITRPPRGGRGAHQRPRLPPAPPSTPASPPPSALPVYKAPRAARRPVPANPASEQLSFEDAPTEPEQRSA
jgi:hypothetical protein